MLRGQRKPSWTQWVWATLEMANGTNQKAAVSTQLELWLLSCLRASQSLGLLHKERETALMRENGMSLQV